MERMKGFVYPSHEVQYPERKNYVPACEREGWDESKIEVLPSYGYKAQKGKELSQMVWERKRSERPGLNRRTG
jgi:hypothetical protein